MGDPFGRCTRSSLLHHLVDLLQGESLGLGDEEIGVDEGRGAERAPDEENFGTKVALVLANHVRGDGGDNTIPEPVAGCRETNTTRPNRQREDLANNHPCSGTPGSSEEKDVDADEGDHSADRARVLAIGDTDDGDNELADNHAHSAPQKDGAATESLDDIKGDGCRADIDKGGDQGDQERVRNGAELLEEVGAEIEDEVDTSPLLHHLKGGTQDREAQVAVRLEKGSLEAIHPGIEVAALGDDLKLILVIGNDFREFLLDVLGALGLTADTSESVSSLVELAALDEVARGLGQGRETGGEENGPEQLESDRDAVRAAVCTVLGAIDDDGGEQKTDSDAKLIPGYDGPADFLRRDLRHVHDDGCRYESDTETSNQATGNKQAKPTASDLQDDTDDEDTAAEDDSGTATDEISQVTSHDGAEECTGRENRDDQGSMTGRHDKCLRRGGIRRRGLLLPCQHGDDIWHSENAVDVTGVVAEENSSESSEGAHQVGLCGDGRLNPAHLSGGHDAASSHCWGKSGC